ncbi:MAG: GMC family oxidoreductase [Saprospiraceae bacterium]|nr:GMC family oxidoreductase [Saprospiraceae bacterium]MBP6567955.1 GMC family oxidoreductase [Saprospiraceae bacterium]
MSEYDYVIIGSGFGGSVSALRLSEKGYKVLVIEKGKWFNNPEDFPTTNWNLRKWMWMPGLGMRGLFKMTLFRHVIALSGVGVGGGSLVYANTLPIPKSEFFNSGHWKGLDNWEDILKPYYETAKKMLGAETHPYMSRSDKAMLQLAKEMGIESSFEKTDVAVHFGKVGVTVSDPYFDGKGPDRTGCNLCGGCMLGCRFNAKNTLDKNYLFLAQPLGAEIMSEKEVYDVIPLSEDGNDGYEIRYKDSISWFPANGSVKTKGVIFAGGVTGTVKLLLKLKSSSLKNLSDMVGQGIRTNSESLIGVTTFDKNAVFSEGIAIGSIVHLDESRHVEPVKYSSGAGFWRLFMAPMVQGNNIFVRFFRMLKDFFIHPLDNLRIFLVDDWSKRTQILLYMESIDSTLRLVRSWTGFLISKPEKGPLPTAFNPKAQEIAHRIETIINGKATVMNTETLLGIPTTAHILGGACMGKDATSGIIDKDNKVFNYKNMMICDGSMISANPGVNPSLSITAISELAMSKIPLKEDVV